MDMKNASFGTKAIHGGETLLDPHGALATPIYQNATYRFDTCEQGGRRFAGEETGGIYTRLGNPTTNVAESRMAVLENTEAALGFASGMGAISSVTWTICKAGSHILADSTLYGCTFAMLLHGLKRYGVDISFVDFADLEAYQAALREETAMVYFETPANPNMKIIDIRQVSDIAHAFNPEIKVVCDNTFATPYLQRPVELGCDVSLHSATKYLNGHGDVLAGFACGTLELMTQVRFTGLKDLTGAVQSPHDSYLVLRGLKTLELRMDRHCENAEKLAQYLRSKPQVEKVYFPGLEDHPGHEIAKKQMSRFGGMLAFEVKGGKQGGIDLLNNMELCVRAVSLGTPETLVEHPASMTHSPYTPEELVEAGISQGLIRVSAGLECIADIIADFEQSFAKMK